MNTNFYLIPGQRRRRFEVNPSGPIRAGKVRAQLYASVIEGKRYTTAQVAEILDVSHSVAASRIKRGPYPLRWAALMQQRLPRK